MQRRLLFLLLSLGLGYLVFSCEETSLTAPDEFLPGFSIVTSNGSDLDSTNQRNVRLHILAPAPEEVIISNFSDFHIAQRLLYSEYINWELLPQIGRQYVFVKVINSKGSTLPTVSDSINAQEVYGFSFSFANRFVNTVQRAVDNFNGGTALRYQLTTSDVAVPNGEWLDCSDATPTVLVDSSNGRKDILGWFCNDFDTTDFSETYSDYFFLDTYVAIEDFTWENIDGDHFFWRRGDRLSFELITAPDSISQESNGSGIVSIMGLPSIPMNEVSGDSGVYHSQDYMIPNNLTGLIYNQPIPINCTFTDRAGNTIDFSAGDITFLIDVDFPEMVDIPADTFSQGDTLSLLSQPIHHVELTHDFAIGKYEITNEEFAVFLEQAWSYGLIHQVGSSHTIQDSLGTTVAWVGIPGETSGYEIVLDPGRNTFTPVEGRADHPVHLVSWYGATRYCDWLTEQYNLQYNDNLQGYYQGAWDQIPGPDPYNPYTSDGFRLPTEAEWELAARTNAGFFYPWGDSTVTCNKARWLECVGLDTTVAVDALPDGYTPSGIANLAGNVAEYCNDWLGEYEDGNFTDPWGPATGEERIARGGSWNSSDTLSLRGAARKGYPPSEVWRYLGFRIARTVGL
jgi:formylglycine-generating enzyme required for sulfatase activity